MRIVISSGVKENGIPVGNAYDKYGSSNPIIRLIMKGFESTMSSFVAKAAPDTIHEVGCGEGYWVLRWNEQGILARGSDFLNTSHKYCPLQCHQEQIGTLII